MALVISMVSCKGGVGKSMLSHLFAVTLAGAPINKKVLVLDASVSKSLSYLTVLYNQDKYKLLSVDVDDIPTVLSKAANDYDLIFLDVPSDIENPKVKKALVCCDQFVVLSNAEMSAQIGCKKTLEVLLEIDKLRAAAGFTTITKVLANDVEKAKDGGELYALLKKQGITHFEQSLVHNKHFGYNYNNCSAMMDYVTQGVAWSNAQDIFHSVFIEFHESIH